MGLHQKNRHFSQRTTALEFWNYLWTWMQGFSEPLLLSFPMREESHNNSGFPHRGTEKYLYNGRLSFPVPLPDKYKEFLSSCGQQRQASWQILSSSGFHLPFLKQYEANHDYTRIMHSIHCSAAFLPAISQTVFSMPYGPVPQRHYGMSLAEMQIYPLVFSIFL